MTEVHLAVRERRAMLASFCEGRQWQPDQSFDGEM
jgi:hypothetical protein